MAFIALCSSPDWVRWHSSTKTNRSPLASKSGRQGLLHLLDVAGDVADLLAVFLAAELVDQRADQPRRGGVERGDQVRAALGAVDVFVDALEHLLDLLVQLGAVGDDQHAGVGDVLPDPLGQPDHDQALARALGVPDDAALAPLHVLLRGPHAEILVVAAELLDPGVEDDEVVDQFQEAGLAAELDQCPVQRVLDGARLPSRSGSTSPASGSCRSAGPRCRCRP